MQASKKRVNLSAVTMEMGSNHSDAGMLETEYNENSSHQSILIRDLDMGQINSADLDSGRARSKPGPALRVEAACSCSLFTRIARADNAHTRGWWQGAKQISLVWSYTPPI